MPPRKSEHRRPHDAGSSLVEVAVALSVFTIVTGAIWFGVSSSARAADGVSTEVTVVGNEIVLSRTFRAAVSRVRPPFWESDRFTVSGDGTLVVVPFLDGDAERILEIRIEGNELVLDTAGEIEVVNGVVEGALGILEEGEGRAIGLSYRGRSRSGRPIAVDASFGSVPLRRRW